MSTKEMYKNMLCRFINSMIVDAEYGNIKEIKDIDFEGLCNIVRAYDKASSNSYDRLESMKTVKSKDDDNTSWSEGTIKSLSKCKECSNFTLDKYRT